LKERGEQNKINKIRVMFQDEGRFGRINDPRRCWAPPGIRPSIGKQIIREFTYVYAAVSPTDGVLDSLVIPEVSAEAMSIFLQEVSLRHLDESIIIFLDGAGWHKAKDLKIPDNIKLSKLPPYSPELNPTEHIWEEIREKWFENKVFLSIDAVVDTLEQALHTLENDNERVQNLSGFDWIISGIMNAT